jgi:hypothetical protein
MMLWPTCKKGLDVEIILGHHQMTSQLEMLQMFGTAGVIGAEEAG